MSFLTEYNEKVLPLSKELEKLTNKPHLAVDDSWTVIPVNIKKDGRTVRVIESGLLLECYHEKVEKNNCLTCGEFVE